jgi:hypothetical protein
VSPRLTPEEIEEMENLNRQNNQLEVKTTDGKTSTIVLNEKTKIVRGKTRTSADGIEAGERIVVTATEKKSRTGRPR